MFAILKSVSLSCFLINLKRYSKMLSNNHQHGYATVKLEYDDGWIIFGLYVTGFEGTFIFYWRLHEYDWNVWFLERWSGLTPMWRIKMLLQCLRPLRNQNSKVQAVGASWWVQSIKAVGISDIVFIWPKTHFCYSCVIATLGGVFQLEVQPSTRAIESLTGKSLFQAKWKHCANTSA